MSKLTWLAPIRSKTRRTYDDYKTDFAPDGSHTPYLIRKLLNSPKIAAKFRDFIREFGEKSGLLDSIAIRQFGKTDVISPFALDIELDGKKLNIKNVGYGISQALPVVVEIYEGPRKGWYAIQQPEIHLHPRAQAALGDLIYSSAAKDKKKFLIETHSDYTIDRFCSNYRKSDKHRTRPDAQVLFFKRTRSGNEVCSVQIDPSGEYSPDQPKEFREFFIKEQLNTLGIRS
jgi:predicted ATPase